MRGVVKLSVDLCFFDYHFLLHSNFENYGVIQGPKSAISVKNQAKSVGMESTRLVDRRYLWNEFDR